MNPDQIDPKIIACRELLETFGNLLHGAIDFWTVVCLGEMPRAKSFVLHYSDLMRSSLVAVFATMPYQLHPRNYCDLLDTVRKDSQLFQESFLVLERCRTAELSELRLAADIIRRTYHTLRDVARELVSVLHIDLEGTLFLTPDRQAYIDSIFDKLFDHARYVRSSPVPSHVNQSVAP